ncbi:MULTISPECIES: MFS transporter [unclassified Streptomyces]|uniref:MFS transporter n=1 Tax=unclassified Streptomyces TaxID=2593676 RepID=UPI00081BA88F|nr:MULTISPECIES: MFS transporter [unclassified Streptomyces]MYQ50051.1 MFS transporter [Streptomyces sp. SID4941]SCD32542.1 Nitrate/nitrite transporter NarK [Streptomyces sp. PalvLS-984]SDE14105.1 Nitrate/nitrite transporter NarK [Streptomyces sp. AmelKG-A3]
MGATAHSAITGSAVERSTIRKVSIRLVPFVALMFFVNYLDRTAVSFAEPNGMGQDLALTAAQFGFASGVFFIGYIILEVPSNMALHKFGARRWLARIMISWGIVALLFTWVQNSEQLYTLRFLLGVAEAGFFPGAILFLSQWVPSRHRTKVLGLFYLAQPLTTVIGAPLAGWFINQHGLFGLEGWRVMFLGVSIPAILLGVIAWFYLIDKPADAKWLTPAEKDWLTTELAAENSGKTGADEKTSHGKAALKSAFTNSRVWTLALIYFGFIYGLYALAFFLPTIINGFQEQFGTTFSVMDKAYITAIPYLPAAVVLYFWSRHATRHGVRTWHIAGPAVVGGVSIPLALYMGSPAATVAVITVTACAIFAALPVFWSVPSQFLTGAAAAAGIALINTAGNVAGFAAGYVTGWLKDFSGDYYLPLFLVGAFMLMSAALMLWLANRSKGRGADQGRPLAEVR